MAYYWDNNSDAEIHRYRNENDSITDPAMEVWHIDGTYKICKWNIPATVWSTCGYADTLEDAKAIALVIHGGGLDASE